MPDTFQLPYTHGSRNPPFRGERKQGRIDKTHWEWVENSDDKPLDRWLQKSKCMLIYLVQKPLKCWANTSKYTTHWNFGLFTRMFQSPSAAVWICEQQTQHLVSDIRWYLCLIISPSIVISVHSLFLPPSLWVAYTAASRHPPQI